MTGCAQPEIAAHAFSGVLLERYHYEPGPPSSYPVHVHDTYQLGIALDRGGAYRFRGVTRPVPTGGLVAVHPGELHSVGDTAPRDSDTRFLMLYADVDVVRAAVRDAAGRVDAEPFFGDAVFDADLVRSFRALFSADTQWDLARETRLLVLFAGLAARHADDRPALRAAPLARPELLRVREFLHAHPATNVSLARLCSISGLGRYALVRQFARHFGVPPHAYHLQLRIDLARRQLADGATASRVAASTGFFDQSHFGRHFRRLVGVPPGRYRQLHHGGAPGLPAGR